MGSEARRLTSGALLFAAGVAAALAWRYGVWGTVCGTLLVAAGLLAERRGEARRATPPAPPAAPVAAPHLLLDAAPTPLVAVEQRGARALNRAARRLFATDTRLPDPPAPLFDPAARHLRHEGRSWRIDRVTIGDSTVAALIDIEQEERAAEARAAAELIQVLGHELLNGLAPIASLAESGAAALDRSAPDAALLREILQTLARRAEGLLRFTEAYRSLARLPHPTARLVALADLTGDLARLFAGRWPQTALTIALPRDATWSLDRDQVTQTLWALLQNAAEAPATRIALDVTAQPDRLTIDIVDDGPGIDPAHATRIFRPFHTAKPGGTGVGLSLARQIAHAHGGTLSLLAGPSTTFRLVLPCARAQNP
ncbi:signal transduction histidine kinase [Sphingomonas sp. BE138]|uniref:sensor histidine kinase n=1 Tax=Sphingomonas sp. BE138 TaxID=2817845 RepID=UPI0028611DDA|nr:HAMP domain-containing sensor histidine kinase [Sphingomonas sp. BE138]MDR6787720.1 signal transduction histidine kinase [Sphingomonas sp. BE138]